MKKTVFLLAFALAAAQNLRAQNEDVEQVGNIFENTLTQSSCYEWLRYLCKNIGGRPGGSPAYTAAVAYTSQMLDTMGADTVWLQPVKVPYWQRGKVANVRIINSQIVGSQSLSAIALGFSGGTPKTGISGEVVEVRSLAELEKLGERAKGKIIFFNRPMDATKINTFHAYGGAVDQRGSGPKRAAELGAVATLVRSMTLRNDDVPHSGVTMFGDQKPIPALALGIQSADLLSELLGKEQNLRLNIQTDCSAAKDQIAHNVIAEIRGSTLPNEIIVVGGHLDAWDVGEGAHDDGAGCVQAMEVLHLFKRLGIRPRRTIRVVLFANEENGMYGAVEYARWAKENKKQRQFAAVESDAGGHTPRGFVMDALPESQTKAHAQALKWREILAPYGLVDMQTGGSAADIGKLRDQGTILFGYRPDSQRYFDYHHSANDVFETINKRELELGAAGMSALIFLIDKYGF
jgi:carboxypeptidase Q